MASLPLLIKESSDLHLKIPLQPLLGVGRPESSLKQLAEIMMLLLLQVANIIRLYFQADISMFFQLLILLLFVRWYHVLFEVLFWHNCMALR